MRGILAGACKFFGTLRRNGREMDCRNSSVQTCDVGTYSDCMGITPKARRLNRRFREFLAKGLQWAVAAKKAGYSDTTIEKKAAVLKRRAGVQVQKRNPNGFVQVVRKVREWSPVS